MTIARLQQWISVGLIGSAGAWVAWRLSIGEPASALWALVLAVVHAPILGLETAWAAWAALRPAARRPLGASTSEPAALEPYPALSVWLRAWAREVLHSLRVFGWQQPWRYQALPDHLPDQAAGRRGVLLVHGFVCNRGFWNTWMRQLRRADVPHVAVTAEPPFGDIARQAETLQAAWQRLFEATGRAPLLVGHSMGGLLIRSWLAQQPQELAMAHEVITIGSPHHGTALAQFAQSEAARQMQLLSPFLQALAARESPERRSRFTCYWSVCDHIVFPAQTATLAGADNRHLAGHPHVGLAEAPEILGDVLQRVQGKAGRPVSVAKA